MFGLFNSLTRLFQGSFSWVQQRLLKWTQPKGQGGTLTDLARPRSELIAENALLRQQLIILRRQIKRPACTKDDRVLLVILARAVHSWKRALLKRPPLGRHTDS